MGNCCGKGKKCCKPSKCCKCFLCCFPCSKCSDGEIRCCTCLKPGACKCSKCCKCCTCHSGGSRECCPCCEGCGLCDGCCVECACCIPICPCFCCRRCCGARKTVDSEELKKFRAEALKAHNESRKKHGAPLLKRNRQLDKVAQQWANHLAESGDFTHSKNEFKGHRLGENIANKWSSAGADYTGQEVTDQWYKEEPQYDYKGDSKTLNAADSLQFGHFTQVVWGGSKELGVGKSKTTNGKCIVVCNYYPAGNIIGHFKENVFEPKK